MNKKNKEITYNELAKAMEDALAKLVEKDARIATSPSASVDALSSIFPLKINSGTNAKFAWLPTIISSFTAIYCHLLCLHTKVLLLRIVLIPQ